MYTKDTIHQAFWNQTPVVQEQLHWGGTISVDRIAATAVEQVDPKIDIKKYRYLYDPPEKRQKVLAERLQRVCTATAEAHGVEPDFAKLDTFSQVDCTFAVMVTSCCLLPNGSVACTVEEAPGVSAGRVTANLNLEALPSATLYPGQMLVVRGRLLSNPAATDTSRTITVTSLVSPVPFPLPAAGMDVDDAAATEATRVVLCAGPYDWKCTATVTILTILLRISAARRASVVVLTGPFVALHPDGHVDERTDYDTQFDHVAQTLATELRHYYPMRVVLAPSLKDLCAEFVFPQPQFDVLIENPEILSVSNPAFLTIGGLRLALSTNDILQHLSAAIVEKEPDERPRIARIASQVVKSRCFYPLVPGAEDSQLDFSNSTFQEFPGYTPDVLLLPSVLPPFAHEVDGSLVINPGQLIKRSFAELAFRPRPPGKAMAEVASVDFLKFPQQ
eukprot:TRINITY_DN83302_c0_g1_i1.p1 TRINITY_DN83302_c0_g1~~TRINITY_DN83302_c0_g1_i1.p1  ORF type:complete len:447 (+),score=65.18 TRINITY_DN83302_c0_g1_i1:41-1381(+)